MSGQIAAHARGRRRGPRSVRLLAADPRPQDEHPIHSVIGFLFPRGRSMASGISDSGLAPNAGQEDADADWVGDVCDP